jgi:5-methylcytosine-specific restriction endonuclease McrA
MTEVTPDQKPRKRTVNAAAVRSKMADDPLCRVCSGKATDAHHILLRSQGGDDVEENIMPLCHDCHMSYHAGQVNLWIRPRELLYVIDRLGRDKGVEYLKRRRVEWS